MKELICYCFGYSEDDLRRDVAVNGRSTIVERIMREKRAGRCECETRNPKRR